MTADDLKNITATREPAYAVTTTEVYDSEGALKFLIATILVYSILGVFCTLLIRVKRKHGRTQQGFVHDVDMAKYHKYEKQLRYDYTRLALQNECSLMAERVKEYERKIQLQELEKQMPSSDFANTHVHTSAGHSVKNNKKKEGLEVGDTVGKMGLSLFYIGNRKHQTDTAHDEVDSSAGDNIKLDKGWVTGLVNVPVGVESSIDCNGDTAVIIEQNDNTGNSAI